MNIYKFLIVQCFISTSLCETSIEIKEKLMNGFIVYYNNLPNQLYTCDEGVLQSAQQIDEKTYQIEVNLKVSAVGNSDATKLLTCTSTVRDLDDAGVSVQDNVPECEEQQKPDEGIIDQPTKEQVEATETPVEKRPVQLDNEIEANTAVTSGEQFIAIPRERPCVGCSSHVNPQAAGVSDLANLGIRHLNKHEPNVRHSLESIVDVERQVQVVNGVRYIFTLLVNFNNCTDTETELCASMRTCKISVLVKPWVDLPSGRKHRSIIANNCTDDWIYGDNGEVLPEDADENRADNQIDGHSLTDDSSKDEIKAIHHSDVQSQPNVVRELTDEQVKSIEEQIISNKRLVNIKTEDQNNFTALPDSEISKQHIVKDEVVNQNGDNSLPTQFEKPIKKSGYNNNLNQDKQKAIDELLDFFNFAGFNPVTEIETEQSRMKRSYDYDLQVLSLAENYQDIKKRLENAKFVYTLAQIMVEYLNDMDNAVKNRVLKNVLNAEEEFENYQHFVYIQALVGIPCDKVECELGDTTKICNGVIDNTNANNPQVLNTFCHYEQKDQCTGTGKQVLPDDLVLQTLIKTAIKKIESESTNEHALRLNKVVSANTRQLSGTLTKMSLVIEYINCNKSVPYLLKKNCTVLGELGSMICDVIFLERHWLKEKKLSYTCTDIPVEVSMSKEIVTDKTIDDPQILEMLRDALQKLEMESNRNNRQKIVKVNSVLSQIIAGFLTKIEFLVGYTTCSNEYALNQPSTTCLLLTNERLRKCVAQFWDRSWIEDGRQMEVACDDNADNSDSFLKKHNDFTTSTEKLRKKRSYESSLTFVGGQSEHNINDPKYKALALESLQKFMKSSSSRQHYDIIKIDRVTTQIVSGVLTRIYFIISPTNCEVSTDGTLSSSKCAVVNTDHTYNCTSHVLEQGWVGNKQISVSCEDKNGNARSKRSLPGGSTEKDPTDPKYIKLAEESLNKFVGSSNQKESLQLVNVEKVTVQVVSGTLTKLTFTVSSNQNNFKCNSEIWEQPWLNKKVIKVTCDTENQQNGEVRNKRSLKRSEIEHDSSDPCKDRAKRHIHTGGKIQQDPNDPKYMELAEESFRKYLDDVGDSNPHKILQVIKVTTQVVSGTSTIVDFEVSQLNNGDIIACQADVWEQPWLHKREINVQCNNKQKGNTRAKRQGRRRLLGGKKEQDPSDAKYLELAKESLQKYLTDTGNQNRHEVVKIIKVYTQVVSGTKTYINYEVSELNNSEVIICESTVWEQPWLSKKEINVSCKTNGSISRKKRDIIQASSIHNKKGNKELKDPKNKNYYVLAAESLRKYESTHNNVVNHKVVDVKHVETQLASGTIYTIDYTATPVTCATNVSENRCISENIIYCHTRIWSKPWLHIKDIDVSCYKNSGEENEEEQDDDGDQNSDNDVKISHAKPNMETVTPHVVRRPEGLVGAPSSMNVNDLKYKKLAHESLHKYLATSNRKYVHKVTKIHSVTEQVVEGIKTIIEYSVSPTYCLRNEDTRNEDDCDIKKPQVVLLCFAEIYDQPGLVEKDINVNCKKDRAHAKRHKRDIELRETRQNAVDDDYVDDEMSFYYANRAVQHFNDRSRNGHLFKLVTIHAVQHSEQMKTEMVRMYIELAETFCLRHQGDLDLQNCEEMDGLNHNLCLARLWPSPDDELVVRHVSVICDDEDDFESISGLHLRDLLVMSIKEYERSPDVKYKTVHQGEPHFIPSLDSKNPVVIHFLLATTNCTKNVNLTNSLFPCYIDIALPTKMCVSYIWLMPNGKSVRTMTVSCSSSQTRTKRSVSDPTNTTTDDVEIQKLVTEALEKLEMESIHRYKQRILQINSYSTKITSGKVTTIDFDVGYTSCLKYEWVANATSCDFLEHLPRRHCIAQIWQRLWLNNGKNIEIRCEDDETPLEAHIEFESAEMATELARAALKHIEAKYPHPRKQKVVRIFSLEKQVVAGIHYRMKVEVGLTDCMALSAQEDCKFVEGLGLNKFCRVNVWVRPWTDHPPNYRVSCDYQDSTSTELYRNIQAEHLFFDFITTYNPYYTNDHNELRKRFEIFKANVRKMHELNVYERGTARYGVTRFSDLSHEEFRAKYTGLNHSLRNPNHVPMSQASIPKIKIPENFDWRDYDAVTEVKDQGVCGSCWAFSVTGNIEGQWKMQSGQLVSLSEQELVDCDKLDEGCNGGLPDNAYRAIEQLGGLESETDYPYEAEDDKCAFNKSLTKVQITGAVNISSNETDMAKWLLHNGPISIGINANAMQFYMGGISHPWKMLCNPTNLDHGVLIVGFGIKDYPLFHKRLPYWIVKNSWGKSWGEQGYYRVYRGDGTCGVNQMASSAVI